MIAILIGASILIAGGLLLSRSLPKPWLQSETLEELPDSQPEPAKVRQAPARGNADAIRIPSPSVSTSINPAPPRSSSVETAQGLQKSLAAHQGILRVSNPTEHPVRVALLTQKLGNSETDTYEAPAHWDFEPGEGATKGLLLSLPNRSLKLKRGDVLVAFAQDGSRRYWGPYVVGETSLPLWNSTLKEWELQLQP